jgi:predicted Holliday junction resolvase-like endonuclease
MGEYFRYLVLILIGMVLHHIWSYIKHLERANTLLASDMVKQLKEYQEKEKTNDQN